MASFNTFYNAWFDHLSQLVQQLATAPRPPTTPDQHSYLEHLDATTIAHYAEYYRTKSTAAKRDIFSILAAPWASSLEHSLHWIAGWRPATVFHLIYTEAHILFESRIVDILCGLKTGDLGDLSPSQFR